MRSNPNGMIHPENRMAPVLLKVVNRSGNPLPTYATEGSSGMDVRACLNEDVVFQPMQRMAVPTGLWIEIPPGFEVQVRPRSGLALKHGITCLNTPGTIDSDYGERIAQLVLQRVERASWSESDTLEASERGEGGFGHTGRQ